MNLGAYITRRLALMIFVIFGVLTITFVVSHIIPADPIAAAYGGQAPPELIEKIRHEWGLDRPLHEQYVAYMWDALHGSLGNSIKTTKPVIEDLRRYFPATFELSTTAIILAIIIGIPLGIASAVKRNKISDHIARVFSILGISMPVFWLGLLLLVFFYYQLGVLPGPGRLDTFIEPPPNITGMITLDSLITGRWDAFFNSLQRLILPSFVLAFASIAAVVRITRSSMLDVLRQDYIRTAKSKGLKNRIVIMKHALRNALIPTTTIVGLRYGSLLEGAVLTETIFAWPGVGRYMVGAILYNDFPAIMGSVLLIAIVYCLANLTVDIIYGFLDPRIRVGE